MKDRHSYRVDSHLRPLKLLEWVGQAGQKDPRHRRNSRAELLMARGHFTLTSGASTLKWVCLDRTLHRSGWMWGNLLH
jgi:hypothetical protein